MIIVIPVNNDKSISNTFGRAVLFAVINSESNSVDYIENTQNLNAVQGAGIQSAQKVINNNGNILITKHCGPKAFKVLQSESIRVFLTNSNDLSEAIKLYNKGQLEELTQANVDGHWQ